MGEISKHKYEGGDREGWLALRNSMDDRVGGSELGTIAGHNPFSSFLRLLEEKVGLRPEPDLSKKEAVREGHDLEYYVAERFEEISGKKVHVENCIFTNSDYPNLEASIDRKIANEDSGLECKTVKDSVMRRFPHGDFPSAYYDQCCLYLAVTELKRWYLSMIVWGTEHKNFLMTRVEAEEKRWKELREKFYAFDVWKEKHDRWQEDMDAKVKLGLPVPEVAFEPKKPEGCADDTDADYAEWVEKWQWLEAVYYLDDDEISACQPRAAHFIECVKTVKEYVSQQTFENATERQAFLQSAIEQVVDPEDIDGSDQTKKALFDLRPTAVEGSEVRFEGDTPENKKLKADLDRRAEIAELIDALVAEKDTIDNGLIFRMKDSETGLIECTEEAKASKGLTGWKITYKNSSGRETANVEAVKGYFAAKGEAVPDGLVKVGDSYRTLRVYPRKPKKPKGKGKAASKAEE